jgi:hypothetical protein
MDPASLGSPFRDGVEEMLGLEVSMSDADALLDSGMPHLDMDTIVPHPATSWSPAPAEQMQMQMPPPPQGMGTIVPGWAVAPAHTLPAATKTEESHLLATISHPVSGAAAAAVPSLTADGIIPPLPPPREHLDSLVVRARSKFLHKMEVEELLSNVAVLGCTIHTEAQQRPPAGTLLFYDKSKVRSFRNDGYMWRKKKDGKQVQEYHEKLKVQDVTRSLTCCYTRCADDGDNLQRRVFWLSDRPQIAMVHYLRPDDADKPSRRKPTVAAAAAAVKTEQAVHHQDMALAEPTSPLDENDAHMLGGLSATHSLVGTPLLSSSLLEGEGAGGAAEGGRATVGSVAVVRGDSSDVGGHVSALDCSPDWGYVEGGEKVLIVFDDSGAGAAPGEETPPAAAAAAAAAAGARWRYSCVFGGAPAVDGELIRPGVVRCMTPHHVPGEVPLWLRRIPWGRGVAPPPQGAGEAAAPLRFTFRRRQHTGLSTETMGLDTRQSETEENEFYVRLLRSVGAVSDALSRAAVGGGGKAEPGGGGGTMDTVEAAGPASDAAAAHAPEESCERAAVRRCAKNGCPAQLTALPSSQNAPRVLDRASASLTQRMVELCLERGRQQQPECLQALGTADRDGVTMLHCAAALGFVEPARLMLEHGVRDAIPPAQQHAPSAPA